MPLGRRCKKHGHDWFPDDGPREFIPIRNHCLRCGKTDVRLPTGECLGKHPLAEHYNEAGELVPMDTCVGPR